MDVLRLRETESIRPIHAVVVTLLIATVGGSYLLLSATEQDVPVDGAIEWNAESPLRAVVRLLCLNYAYPTFHQGDFKVMMLGIGAGLVALCIGIATLFGNRSGDVDLVAESPGSRRDAKHHIAPLAAAQIMFGLYVLWSFASTRWSAASDLSTGGSILLGMHWLWSLGLGHGLNRRAAVRASYALIVLTVITALVAIWYYYGRNPTLRAKFPFGNPTFLAAALIPCWTLAVTLAGARILRITGRDDRFEPSWTVVVSFLALLLTATIVAWTFYLSDSRGPMAGALFATLGAAFYLLKGRLKLVPVVLGAFAVIAGGVYVANAANAPSASGRDSTLRFRAYTMDYALQLYQQRPLIGHGQGAFVMQGDTLAVNDVLNDPTALSARIAHAHNEWLEVLADLGTPGFVLVLAALVLTLRAAASRWPMGRNETDAKVDEAPDERYVRAALAGSLVGLMVDAAFGVGLRVSGVGVAFYTVLGLLWALSGRSSSSVFSLAARDHRLKLAMAAACMLAGVASLLAARADFVSARAAYKADEKLRNGLYEEAVEFARASASQLNPQRAIVNRYQLADIHIQAAEFYQSRAADRAMRTQGVQDPGSQLVALAVQDYNMSREHAAQAGEVLGSLLKRAPGFYSHGYLVFLLNRIMARDPEATAMSEQFRSAALSALEGELRRQPFSTRLAREWVRLAAKEDNVADVVKILSRPLRFAPLTSDYVDLLERLMGNETVAAQVLTIVQEAESLSAADIPTTGDDWQRWSPEILRLGATSLFMSGDYDPAATLLRNAAAKYEVLVKGPHLGTASCYFELAITRFFEEPTDPDEAITLARKARGICPESLAGRRMTNSITRREIEFLLAAGRDEDAASLLREAADLKMTESVLRNELSMRYLDLTNSLLQRRQAQVLRQPPSELAPLLMGWIQRSIALEPTRGAAHYMAADLEFHEGNIAAAIAYLREAWRLRFDRGVLMDFVTFALEQTPGNNDLQQLLAELSAENSQPPSPAIQMPQDGAMAP